MLNQLEIEKLLSIPLSVDLIYLDQSKAIMLQEVIGRLPELGGRIVWCTLEEYNMLGNDILSLYFNVCIFRNNLFYKTFPCLYEIPEKDRLLETYFSDDVSEDGPEKDVVYDVFLKYYGELRKVANDYYIVYLDESEPIGFFTKSECQLDERHLHQNETATLELSEEEDELLQLTQCQLKGEVFPKEILIAYTGDIDAYSQHYRERLLVMQNLFVTYRSTGDIAVSGIYACTKTLMTPTLTRKPCRSRKVKLLTILSNKQKLHIVVRIIRIFL